LELGDLPYFQIWLGGMVAECASGVLRQTGRPKSSSHVPTSFAEPVEVMVLQSTRARRTAGGQDDRQGQLARNRDRQADRMRNRCRQPDRQRDRQKDRDRDRCRQMDRRRVRSQRVTGLAVKMRTLGHRVTMATCTSTSNSTSTSTSTSNSTSTSTSTNGHLVIILVLVLVLILVLVKKNTNRGPFGAPRGALSGS
jgi:heme A synthase